MVDRAAVRPSLAENWRTYGRTTSGEWRVAGQFLELHQHRSLASIVEMIAIT
jgi:hypothetical protein